MCEPWHKIMKEEKKEMSKYRNKKRRLNEIVQLKQNIYLQNAKKKKNQVDNDFFSLFLMFKVVSLFGIVRQHHG